MHTDRSAGLLLTNLTDPTTNLGAELLATWRRAPWSLTATYSFVRSRETESRLNRAVPLTPRHSAGIVGMWKREKDGRWTVDAWAPLEGRNITGGFRVRFGERPESAQQGESENRNHGLHGLRGF